MCPPCAWDGPQHGRHSLHLGSVRFSEETGSANGDNIAQHCATSRRTDFDYALRDFPGMEVGAGTVQRQPLQPLHAFLVAAALRLPLSLDKATELAEESPALLEMMSE